MNTPISTPQQVAYLIFRFTLGVTFFTFGLSKLFMTGPGNFATHMLERFEGVLPEILLIPFVWTLPYAEFLLGLMLIAGFFTLPVLAATGVLVAMLTFGAVLSGDPGTAANNLIYAIVTFFLLWNLPANHYSIDQLMNKEG